MPNTWLYSYIKNHKSNCIATGCNNPILFAKSKLNVFIISISNVSFIFSPFFKNNKKKDCKKLQSFFYLNLPQFT